MWAFAPSNKSLRAGDRKDHADQPDSLVDIKSHADAAGFEHSDHAPSSRASFARNALAHFEALEATFPGMSSGNYDGGGSDSDSWTDFNSYSPASHSHCGLLPATPQNLAQCGLSPEASATVPLVDTYKEASSTSQSLHNVHAQAECRDFHSQSLAVEALTMVEQHEFLEALDIAASRHPSLEPLSRAAHEAAAAEQMHSFLASHGEQARLAIKFAAQEPVSRQKHRRGRRRKR